MNAQFPQDFAMKDKLTPKAVVSALDAHIIGQTDAKRAVAVALRNRWRRQQLSDELRDEYTLRFQPTSDGKFCLSPPGTREAYCVQTGTRRHVSAAFVRATASARAAASDDLVSGISTTRSPYCAT